MQPAHSDVSSQRLTALVSRISAVCALAAVAAGAQGVVGAVTPIPGDDGPSLQEVYYALGLLNPAEGVALVVSRDDPVQIAAIDECMAEAGFPYFSSGDLAAANGNLPSAQLSAEDFAGQYALNITWSYLHPNDAPPSALDVFFDSLTAGQWGAYVEAAARCEEASRTVSAEEGATRQLALLQGLEEMRGWLQADPTVIASRSEWVACMKRSGYDSAHVIRRCRASRRLRPVAARRSGRPDGRTDDKKPVRVPANLRQTAGKSRIARRAVGR